MNKQIDEMLVRVSGFRLEAEELFGAHENNNHATHITSDTRLKIDLLKETPSYGSFLQAIACIEIQQYQAAIVMAWIGVIDFLQRFGCRHSEKILENTNTFPKDDIELVRNKFSDMDLINILSKSELLTNQRTKNLKSLLNDRNGAAHPSDSIPTQSIALGAIQKMAHEIIAIKNRENQQNPN